MPRLLLANHESPQAPSRLGFLLGRPNEYKIQPYDKAVILGDICSRWLPAVFSETRLGRY